MFYFFAAILICVILFLVWLVFDLRKKVENNAVNDSSNEKMAAIAERLAAMAEQYRDLRSEVGEKLTEANKVAREHAGQTIRTMEGITSQSSKQIAEVVAGLTKLEETNKQVVNFSAQLQNLQDILKNPKQRGVLGEYFLEETLKNVLPPNSYQMQYKLGSDEKTGKELIVDAVVFVKEKIIPVDSKFSLENYERILASKDSEEREQLEKVFKQDLKDRIDETSKYIRPEKNTTDFAFMFIPSEAIYYDLLVNKVGAVKISTRDLIEYAFKEKKVVIVSPTSFLAYLQTVLQGLRALQIEESAKQIKTNVEKLGKHLLSFEEYMKKVHNSLGVTVGHFNSAYKELGKIDKDVVKITGGERSIEPSGLDRPKED